MVTRAVIKYSRFWVVRIIFVALYFVIALPMSYAGDDPKYTVTISPDDSYSGYVFCVNRTDNVLVNSVNVEYSCGDNATYYFIDISDNAADVVTLAFTDPIRLSVFFKDSYDTPDMYVYFDVLEGDADAGFYCMQDVMTETDNNFSLGYQMEDQDGNDISFKCMDYYDLDDNVNNGMLPNKINPASFIPISDDEVSLQTFLNNGIPCCTTTSDSSLGPEGTYYLDVNDACLSDDDYFENCKTGSDPNTNHCEVRTCTNSDGVCSVNSLDSISCYYTTLINSQVDLNGYYKCTYDSGNDACIPSTTPTCIDCSGKDADDGDNQYAITGITEPDGPTCQPSSNNPSNLKCSIGNSGVTYIFTKAGCGNPDSTANAGTSGETQCQGNGDEPYDVYSFNEGENYSSSSSFVNNKVEPHTIYYKCVPSVAADNKRSCSGSNKSSNQYMW